VASTTASSNITIENQGTSIGTVGTINAVSPVTASVSGGIGTFTSSGAGGALTIAQSGQILSSGTVAVGTGLNYTVTGALLTLVNSQTNSTGTSGVSFASVTAGNYLILMCFDAPSRGSIPSWMSLLYTYSSFPRANYIYGGVIPASGSLSFALNTTFYIAQYSGVTSVSVSAVTYSNSAGVYSFGVTPSGAENQTFYMACAASANWSSGAGSFTPSQNSLVVQAGSYNANSTGGMIGAISQIPAGTLFTAGFTDATDTLASGGALVTLNGITPSGGSVLSLAGPVYINGTSQSSGFTTLELTTGNTATSVSFSSGTLVINLGTP